MNAICSHYISLQEFSLEKSIYTMEHIWDDVSFHHQPYRETGVSILTALDDIQTMLDDQIVKTQLIRGSPFIKPFENQIKVCFHFYKVKLLNQFLTFFASVNCCTLFLSSVQHGNCFLFLEIGGASSLYPGNHRCMA